MRRWLVLGMREGPTGLRVVRVARHDVRVQVRQRVPEQLVVQLYRLEMLLEGAAHAEELTPVRGGLLRRELGRLGDAAPTPDDDRVAALDARLLEIRVRDVAGEEASSVLRFLGPPLRAHRTAFAPLERIELLRPLHAVSIADRCPRLPKSCTSASRAPSGCRRSGNGTRSPSKAT